MLGNAESLNIVGYHFYFAEDSKQASGAMRSTSNDVAWEYKLSSDEDAEIIGPVSSEKMLELQGEGKFENGGWARKKGMQTFYTIARLDFEIYVWEFHFLLFISRFMYFVRNTSFSAWNESKVSKRIGILIS